MKLTAVAVTVGGAKGVRRQCTGLTRAVVDAMSATGSRRLVVQSSPGAVTPEVSYRCRYAY